MDEKQLSILQVQRVLGMSYPTALKWAKANGEKVIEHGRDKWYVPAQAVINRIEEDQRQVVAMRMAFLEITGNGHN